jgi:hypothetical protein
MKRLVSRIGGFLMLLCWSALTVTAQSKTKFSIETDPSTFALKGYAIHIRIQPASCKRFLIGAGSYGLTLPDKMVDLNKNNRSEGWDVKIKSAYALYGEYYFKEANRGWFVGEQVGLQNFKISNDQEQSAVAADFRNLLLLTYIGYSWHPYKGRFYIKPWAGLGYTNKITGSTTVGTKVYDVAPLFPFVTFHVGYTFR